MKRLEAKFSHAGITNSMSHHNLNFLLGTKTPPPLVEGDGGRGIKIEE